MNLYFSCLRVLRLLNGILREMECEIKVIESGAATLCYEIAVQHRHGMTREAPCLVPNQDRRNLL